MRAHWRRTRLKDPTVQPFSGLSLLLAGLRGQRSWVPQWRSPEPQGAYDALIVGGGGHGLGAAYYLAAEHGLRRVAVLEKGWIGGGNTGRNTTIIRSNYLFEESAALYDHAVQLWGKLSQVLNYNVMFSPRGVMMLAHTVHDEQVLKRHIGANRAAGVDNAWLTPEEARAFCPPLNIGDIRYPVRGAALQRRGGTARHDAVAWGYGRGADNRGVEIHQNTEVTGIEMKGGRVSGVRTTRGDISTRKVLCAVAGSTPRMTDMVGLRTPIYIHPLQAMVSEPLKPWLDPIIVSGSLHVYVSQSARGELVMGASLDPYELHATRSTLDFAEGLAAHMLDLFPCLSHVRVARQWAGMADMTPDFAPIMGKTPVEGFYLDAGWGTWGFKATPVCGMTMAHTVANDANHPLIESFNVSRFADYRLTGEKGAASVGH